MKFSLVGINGSDIHDGNKKLILAFYWQLIRKHTMHVLKSFILLR
jgi:plastin-1